MTQTQDAQEGRRAAIDAERVAALLRRSPDLSVLFDEEGQILHASTAATRLLTGEDPSDALDAVTTQDRLHHVHPDDVERLGAGFSEAKRQPDVRIPVECRSRHTNGGWRHLEGSYTNLLQDPEVSGILLSLVDVTDRVLAERELRERLRVEAALSHIARDFVDRAGDALDACVEDALGTIGSLLGARRGGVYVRDGLTFVLTHGWRAAATDAPLPNEIPFESCPWSQTRLASSTPIVHRSDDDRAVVALPLVWNQQPLGFVEFSAGGWEQAWAVGTVAFLEQFAWLVTTALQRRAADHARQRSEAEVSASAERFRRLVQSSPDLVIVLDTSGFITFASPAGETTFGYPSDALVGTSVFDVIHPEDINGAVDAFANAVVDFEPEMIPLRIRHADGHWIPVEALGSDLLDDPLIGGLVINVRDVSDRVQIAEALRAVQIRFQQAWEHAPIGMTFTDREGDFFKVNPAMCRMLGLPEEELLGTGLPARSHEDDLERALAFHRALFDGTRAECEWEQRLRRADGDWLWVRISATLVRAGNGDPLYGLAQVEDITHRKHSQEQLAYEATHDALTGLPLRKLLLDHLALALAGARRHGTNVAVLFVDLDHFKRVNDSLGHAAGDELLTEVAQRLRTAVRGGDTPGRFGGDEFVVVCPDLADVRAVVVVAERIRALLAKPFRVRSQDLFVGASIGIAVADDAATPDTLLREADSASYRAKQRGRNRYEIFDDELRDSVARRLETESGVRRALDQHEFVVHFQPIVHTNSGRLAGFEALVRWDDPTRGLLRPAEFLTVAEETGLVVPLGRHVLTVACEQLASWQQRSGSEAPFVAVNVSPRQILAPELAADLREIIAATGVSPGKLCVEIPETLLVQDTPQLVALLRELGGFGVDLALDDFGTGYSSLNHLRDLPVGILKIDGTFIAEIGKTKQDATIVGAVVNLAHALDMTVIAEGVETEEQLAVLRELRCDLVQGHYFAPPLSPAEADTVAHDGVL